MNLAYHEFVIMNDENEGCVGVDPAVWTGTSEFTSFKVTDQFNVYDTFGMVKVEFYWDLDETEYLMGVEMWPQNNMGI